jgi:predicted dienelactone hydrolase
MVIARLPRRALLIAGLCAPLAARAQEAADTLDEWRDDARRRSLPLRWRWPVGDAPCALVLHSHGLGGSRDGGAARGEAWRAAGLAVCHLQHPGSDDTVWRDGASRFALQDAASAEQLVARAEDMRFVLDELARRVARGAAPSRRVRLDAIGVAGHSFGAHTVQAVAGQRFPAAIDLSDPRPRAFVAFSPAPASGRLTLAQQFGAITRPFFALTGSLDDSPFGHPKSGAERARVYDGLPPGARALLWLDGADHATFGGGTGRAREQWRERDPRALALEPQHRALIARLSSAWWRAHLLGDAAAREQLAAPADVVPPDRWRRD